MAKTKTQKKKVKVSTKQVVKKFNKVVENFLTKDKTLNKFGSRIGSKNDTIDNCLSKKPNNQGNPIAFTLFFISMRGKQY